MTLREVKELKPVKNRSECGTDMWIAEFSPRDFRLSITEGRQDDVLERLSSVFGEPKLNEIPVFRINAQLFMYNGANIGGYGRDGVGIEPQYNYAPTIIYKDDKLDFGNIPGNGSGYDFYCGTVTNLVKDGENLVEAGKNHSIPAVEGRNPRTMLIQKENGNICTIATDGRGGNDRGLTFNTAAYECKKMNAVTAALFDGGGSSTLLFINETMNDLRYDRQRPIGTAIVAYYALKPSDNYDIPWVSLIHSRTGVYAQLVQRILNNWGYNCGVEDGIVGPNTIRGIEGYQVAFGLSKDGVIGPNTWKSLITYADRIVNGSQLKEPEICKCCGQVINN